MHTNTNIDHAIASVIERREEVNIPNVFSAYFQRVIACEVPEGLSPADTDAIARAALVSFERAMDKYPMPTRPTKKKQASKSSPKPSSNHPKEDSQPAPGMAKVWTRIYSAEVEQLRWEYQKAMLRATAGDDDNRGACLSCGCLLSLREKAALLVSEYEQLERQLEELEKAIPKRRATRKPKKSGHARAVVPFDPYAPSTSAAMI